MGTFLWLSDIHLDPYYGNPSAVAVSTNQSSSSSSTVVCTQNSSIDQYPYGYVGCDAPITLVNALLQHLTKKQQQQQQQMNITFVLVTGDFSRHATDLLKDGISATTTILSTISQALKDAFPNIPIIPCLGNNDVYPDYTLDLKNNNNSHNRILNISMTGFQLLFQSTEERQTYLTGGYYARNVSESLTILVLNTVMYSINHFPNQTYLDDPMGQFAWLQQQLQVATQAGKFVYIVGHIPPTIGSYRHAQLWHDQYLHRYFEILQCYQDNVIIKGHLFGHLHSDEFRLLHLQTSPPQKQQQQHHHHHSASLHDWTIPLYIASSVTPVYGSNPSYRLVQYDTHNGQLLDYQTFYLDLKKLYHQEEATTTSTTAVDTTTLLHPQWIEELPSFAKTYHLKDLSSESLQTLLSHLSDPSQTSHYQEMWRAFLKRQYVSASSLSTNATSCDNVCQSDWLCILQASSQNDYALCVAAAAAAANSVTTTSSSSLFQMGEEGWIIMVSTVGIIGILLLLGCCWVNRSKFLKRRQFLQIGQIEDKDGCCRDRSRLGDIETTTEMQHDHDDMMLFQTKVGREIT
jgi:sphingomyelin phosphodiesterase acid-like 3